MLDENLPIFRLKPSTDNPKTLSTYFYSQYGSDFEPSYSIRHPNPELPGSKNRYAAALYDAFNPEVLYAEVLLIPDWTSPAVSSEQMRLNGGVPPPPEPILPSEFTIQLYNPDQQIVIRQKAGKFTSTPSWEFEMPQHTFRAPSASNLDKTMNDPAASELTPKIAFKWKKDSKLSKDLACFLSGKAANLEGRKKSKEPDITIAIFQGLKEMTLYEPNLQRVEIEDMKGFEVVLLLGAVVIRDVYFGQMKETFNIGAPSRQSSQSGAQKVSTPMAGLRPVRSPDSIPGSSGRTSAHETRVPPTDPRTQWEIDAEAALLKRQAAAEERERKRRDEAEQKQIKKMLEAEEKEKKRKQAEVEKETERLRKLYGQEDSSARPALPARNPAPHRHSSYDPPVSSYGQPQFQQPQFQQPQFQQPRFQQGPGYYQNWQPNPPHGTHGAQPPRPGFLTPTAAQQQQRLKPKTSFFGFRRGSDEDTRLQKKRSAVF